MTVFLFLIVFIKKRNYEKSNQTNRIRFNSNS